MASWKDLPKIGTKAEYVIDIEKLCTTDVSRFKYNINKVIDIIKCKVFGRKLIKIQPISMPDIT